MGCVDMALTLVGGVVTGVYSGAIVSRYSDFVKLKRDLRSVIQNIEYMGDGRVDDLKVPPQTNKYLFNLSSQLLSMSHKKAGLTVGEIDQKIDTVIRKHHTGKLTSEEMERENQEWQIAARLLKPNMFRILSPWVWRL